MAKIMRKKLPVLLFLFILIAVTEGVYLCKHKGKDGNARREYYSSDILSDEFPEARFNNQYDDGVHYRKESMGDKILRAMLMRDGEQNYDNSYRAEHQRNDHSALLREEALKRNEEKDEESGLAKRRRNNRYGKLDDYQYEGYGYGYLY